jgi:uncharacterized membrane protein YeaQ/YmgE (transglycosylase-associated protein family)
MRRRSYGTGFRRGKERLVKADVYRFAAPLRAKRSGSLRLPQAKLQENVVSNVIWIIVIGFVAGVIAKFISPGPNKPAGFVITTLLGIGGAFVATFIGQTIGWYRIDQGAGLIGATIGALLVLFVWNRIMVSRASVDPRNPNAPPRRWL